ncbi:MAG: sulfatase [Armatimonadetes bacterium]|nr:sulfatase [Armatimonadota bacterium]
MNVILISLDTLRADRLSCYGYPRLTSPHIDRAAGQGTIFTECFSTHIPTHPAHTTLFTGKDVMAHQIVSQGAKFDLDPAIRTLSELLREEGYYTAAADNLGRWFARGFEHYEGYQWATDPGQPWRKGEAVNKTVLSVLDRCAGQDRPFFLFLHYWDAHTPYLPPPPFDRMFYEGNEKDEDNLSMDAVWEFENFKWYFAEWMGGVTDIEFPKSQYDAEVAYMDACLSHLFTRLDELNLTEETLLIMTADHGEEMDEHGLWFDHHGLYDTNLHIPLIMRCPGRVLAGHRAGGFVRLMDVAPTILDCAGLGPVAAREGMQGRSALPMAVSPGPISTGTCDALYLTECTWMKKRGLRTHEWKLILEAGGTPPEFKRPDVELYHLTEDPGEQANRAGDFPEVAQAMEAQLMGWVRKRMRETGLPDPVAEREITLRQVGHRPAGI